ncbi:MAG: IS630 family transposase [Terriglobia bacterium]
MSKKALEVKLIPEDKATLQRWASAPTTEQRLMLRARILLAAAGGEATQSIAGREKVRRATISKWRRRYRERGLAGLQDAPRSGPPRRYGESAERRVLTQLDQAPPLGYARWNGRLLAGILGDISPRQVWRILSRHKIHLARRRSWCISTDPEFAPKAAAIVGLYLHPPEYAVVVSVDEKPHIQALERAQGYLRLPNGQALRGFNHEYKRHGTTTLFAALNVLTGQVDLVHHRQRRRRRQFLEFMNDLVAAHDPRQEIHVILDNLNTHKPKHDRWLARHPRVHFHFTPTHASWLNQIECWFSILGRQALKGASFTSPGQLREAIDRFIESYNPRAVPVEWKKEQVHSVHPKRYYADLCH